MNSCHSNYLQMHKRKAVILGCYHTACSSYGELSAAGSAANTSVVLVSTVKMAWFGLRAAAGRCWLDSSTAELGEKEQEAELPMEAEREAGPH